MAEYYSPPPPPVGIHYAYYQPPQPAPPPPPPGAIAPAQPPPTQPYIPQPPPSSFASYGAPFASYWSQGDVRTLFVAGLPRDVKPREIYNLFRDFQGYESSHLRTPAQNSQPFAFAVFMDQQSAIAAMHTLNGMVFDLEKGSTLYIELAKSNSRSKRSRADDEWTGSDKKARGSSAFSRSIPDSGHGSVHMSGMGNSAYNTIGYPPTQSHGNFQARAANETSGGILNKSSAHVPQNRPPCPTLFVANLGPNCTEQELINVFSRCPGFLKLKMQSTYGPPVAFVDFQDTASSTVALNNLQGTILYSSATGDGVRLEYPFSTNLLVYLSVMAVVYDNVGCVCKDFLNERCRYAKSRMGNPRKPK